MAKLLHRFYLLKYFIREAFISIRRNKLLNTITIAMIAVSLSIFGLFLLIYVNLNTVVRHWSDSVQIIAYIDRQPPEDEQLRLDSFIRNIVSVDSVNFVSQKEALEKLKQRLSGHEDLLEGLETNPLPASFEIRLQRKSQNLESVQIVVEQLESNQEFDDIQYGRKWLENLTTVINMLKFLGVFLGLFLFLTVIFIVSNTIKLTLYSREEELNIMKYIGATEAFIKGPFLAEGIIRGFLGSTLSLIFLFMLFQVFMTITRFSSSSLFQFASITFFPHYFIIGLVVLGSILGWCGSLLTLHKFLKTY
ncbi:MAG: ABC transporter permease [bacterium]|nr:ABC transporter permease [bacterium]